MQNKKSVKFILKRKIFLIFPSLKKVEIKPIKSFANLLIYIYNWFVILFLYKIVIWKRYVNMKKVNIVLLIISIIIIVLRIIIGLGVSNEILNSNIFWK